MPDASHSQQDWLLNEQVLWRLVEILGNNGILSSLVPKPIGYRTNRELVFVWFY